MVTGKVSVVIETLLLILVKVILKFSVMIETLFLILVKVILKLEIQIPVGDTFLSTGQLTESGISNFSTHGR